MHYSIICVIFTIITLQTDDPTIRFIIEVAHHGARSSSFTNFNTSKILWDTNHKHGELTNVGLREGYLLGRTLREKYMRKSEILEEKYDDYQVMVKAAPYNAAIMSAYTQMQGFYTPGVGDVLSKMEQTLGVPPVEDLSIIEKEANDLRDAGLPYYSQVLPVHSSEGGEDFLFSTLFQCNEVKYILSNVTNTSEYKALEEKYSTLYKSINSVANIDIKNMIQAFLLYDDIICDMADDHSLKDEFKFNTDIMDTLRDLYSDVWKHVIFGNYTVMLATATQLYREWTTLLNNVVANDNTNANKKQTLNYALYISDASLLLPILDMYGKSLDRPLEFADNFIIQMGVKLSSVTKTTKTLKDYEIVAFFNGQAISLNGNLWMSADEFENMLRKHSLLHLSKSEFIDWCNTIPIEPPQPFVPPEVSKLWNILAMIIEILFFLTIILTCVLVNRKKKGEEVQLEKQEAENSSPSQSPVEKDKASEVKAL